MSWLFVGPNILSGIGQVTRKYANLVDGEYVEFHQTPQKSEYEYGFVFMLPIEHQLKQIDELIKRCKKCYYMTVCETETVNPLYGMLQKYKPMFVPSEFCKNILERQFPGIECKILRHYAPPRVHKAPKLKTRPYNFYTICNALDPRKNIKMLLSAFSHCNLPDARLVIKSTAAKPLSLNIPNVMVINGLITDEQMEKIHDGCHCYVNCSHSEGVGMGAVEAAMRGKPIIITDYGGLKEYVKTPWVVPCKLGEIGFDDFLFTKNMKWGYPHYAVLVKHLKDCYTARVMSFDHRHTREIMNRVQTDLQTLE